MTQTEELQGFEARLLVELRRVVSEEAATVADARFSQVRRLTRAPMRRWALLMPLGAAAVAVVLFAVALVVRDGSAPSAFALESLPDGRIHVTMQATFDEGEALEDELRAAGVDVAVNVVTAHPMLVGTIEFPTDGLPPEGIETGTGEFWVDPEVFSGAVEMLVYVEPAPGDDWNQAPSVFHPDEPLGGLPCALTGPLDTATLEQYAQSVGLTEFTWWVAEGDPAAGRYLLPAETRPNGDVESASRVNTEKLRVRVRPPAEVDQYGHAASPSMNLNVGEAPEPACTSELADRWTDAD